MAFYKRDGEALHQAPNFVYGPEISLTAENHAEYDYPVDGWYWFDSLDAAMIALLAQTEVENGVPQSVTSFQARAALHVGGWLERVEALMADPNIDPVARIAWEYAQELQRQSPTVAAFADALGLTDWQVDELFIQAAQIKA
jgi:hypothetical protein